MTDIEIEIDGQKLKAQPNQTVIQVADDAGIYIPRFCYHKHLSIPANCRMCLVEVEKAPKPLPACATPATDGLKVYTRSQKTLEAQRSVMEFLLINHPLDCPICDQGGECELQDLSMGFGSSHSKYTECKRSVADQDLGPLIATEMTRCIYCTRCVRFGDEIAGFRELGAIGRGEFTEISTYIQHAIQSEVSGNIIELCPVGALTSKPFRFTARAWELDQHPSISPHDCMGSNLEVHTRYGTVMRVVPKTNPAINEVWSSDRDRFSYTALAHEDRLDEPLAKIDGEWRVVSWQQAFEMAASGLKEMIEIHGADHLGALASSSSTLEEFYLLQKLMRALGSPHIDHRLREQDTTDQNEMGLFPGLNTTLETLEQADAIILIGSNVRKEQPILSLRIRKAERSGAQIFAINSVDHRFHFNITQKKIIAPHNIVAALCALLRAFDELSVPDWQGQAEEIDFAMANILKTKKSIHILLGASANHNPEASKIRYLAQTLAELTGGTLNLLTDGANAAGAWLAGAIPHRAAFGKALNHHGLSAYEMLEKPRRAYLLMNVEPDRDCANAHHALHAFKQADFVLALSVFKNDFLLKQAHIILPMTPFTETSGTFVNAMGMWQSFKGAAKPFESARPAWKILRVLGNFLKLEGFDYEDAQAIKKEIKNLQSQQALTQNFSSNVLSAQSKNISLSRIGDIPIYSIDSLVRRAEPLQIAQEKMEGDVPLAKLHPNTAKKYSLKEGDEICFKQGHASARVHIKLDDRIAKDAVYLVGGIEESAELGDLYGAIEIQNQSASGKNAC